MRTVVSCLLATGLTLAAAGTPRAGEDARAELLAVLDRSIKAAGGLEKVAQLRGVSWKGTSSVPGDNAPRTFNHEGYLRGWDQIRMDVDLQRNGANNLRLVLDGGKGWVQNPAGKVSDLPAPAVPPLANFFSALRVAQMLPALKGKEFELAHLGEIKVADRPALGIRVSRKGQPDVGLFFDKENSLPVRTAIRFTDGQGKERELEILYGDYKEFDGLKHFTTVTSRLDDAMPIRTELTEVRPQGDVDAGLFARP